MKRKGKTLRVLQDGHPRRMSDAKNAWRKMTNEQRIAFMTDVQKLDVCVARLGRARGLSGGDVIDVSHTSETLEMLSSPVTCPLFGPR